jgi:hypothetical protein
MDTSGFFPELADTDPLYEVALYTQTMKDKLTRHAEWSNSGWAVSGGYTNWDIGPMYIEPTKTFNNTFSNTTGALSGAINITEAGIYLINAVSKPGSNPGGSALILKHGASLTLSAASGTGTAWEVSTTFSGYLTAGSYVRAILLQQTGSTNSGRISITKLM